MAASVWCNLVPIDGQVFGADRGVGGEGFGAENRSTSWNGARSLVRVRRPTAATCQRHNQPTRQKA